MSCLAPASFTRTPGSGDFLSTDLAIHQSPHTRLTLTFHARGILFGARMQSDGVRLPIACVHFFLHLSGPPEMPSHPFGVGVFLFAFLRRPPRRRAAAPPLRGP